MLIMEIAWLKGDDVAPYEDGVVHYEDGVLILAQRRRCGSL